jgi:hypothetical protein
MSRYIDDNQEKPNTGKQVARWLLVALMLVCVYQIGAGLYEMKHHTQIWAVWKLIEGSFFFIICYAAHWLLGN